MFAVRRATALVLAAAMAMMLSVTVGSEPADAASSVRFSYVQYDSPGSDKGSNSSLNAEYIRIKNYGSKSKSLTGWTVRDKAGHVYKFGTLTLKPGATVTLHTGKGSNSSKHRYWGQSWYIWNNSGDVAVLKNKAGTKLDTCKWGSTGSAKKC
ncbi:lamin tail domain-containing protein [Demequina sp. NBRC 110054]|uniref:lamin tail domain-containing protein n=1 Tax=Demequina sp. NBRC 110054 TaxID=1570343 RepID=UPI001F2ADAA3|nr:lamin tail domain-containing protein [Demequina sp. NBRC 110054]